MIYYILYTCDLLCMVNKLILNDDSNIFDMIIVI